MCSRSAGGWLVAYQVAYKNGEFTFFQPPGAYYLSGCEDASEDGAFKFARSPDTEVDSLY